MKILRLFFIVWFGAAPLAYADPEGLEPVEDGAPVLSESSDPALEPDVTIRRDERGMIKEYRINGLLYKIEVIPEIGPPYYLIDSLGNGQWTRIDGAANPLIVPQWVLIRF